MPSNTTSVSAGRVCDDVPARLIARCSHAKHCGELRSTVVLTKPTAGAPSTATVLFTDLVGSTAIRAELGEEAAEVVRRACDRLLGDAVAEHRGTVVKNTGDGIMATFPGAADAVGAAVAMQQAVDSYNRRRRATTPLALRVGISLGDVTWEENDCFGMPVIEAARLCAAAEGGQILVADLVRLTTRGRGGHTFLPVGALALKGLPEPVVACAVAWERRAQGGVPLPPRLTTSFETAMFGRDEAAEALKAAWVRARDGQRQMVLLAGEPGIGKTRLATEFARAAHQDGGTVLFGGCDEDVGAPYRPFVEALRHYVLYAPDELVATHVANHGGELVRIVPELRRRVPDLPPPQVAEAETERYLLFEAVTGLLSTASEESPVLLVLDDLHWARMPELLLLKHVLKVAMPLRLLVIGTYRDTDLTRMHPLTAMLADWRREAGVQRLRLRGLDEAAVVELVAAAAGHELTERGLALARALHRETEGSPLFIGEILRHLREQGAIFQRGGRWTFEGDVAALGIPEGIKDVIGRRLSRLSEEAFRLLILASVIGREFDLDLLAKVAETDENAVLDTLEEAMAAALVREVPGRADRFVFSHALIHSTLYEELSAARRARLHRRVGEALEALVGAQPAARIDDLARHWLAATQVSDVRKAVVYARQAAERALAGLAFEEAAAYYQQALTVWPAQDRAGEELRCDLLLGLGDAQRRAGNAQYRDTVRQTVEAARGLGDGERFARAVLTIARPGGFMASSNVVDTELLALYEEALAALGEQDSLLRARLLGQLAVELVYAGEHERREALTREAVAIARRVGDRLGLGQVLTLRLFAINHPFTLGERLRLAAELTALAEELGSRELAWHAAYHRAGALLESGDLSGTEQALDELGQLGTELRQPFYGWMARNGAAMLAVLRGEPDAEQRVFAALEFGTAGGQPDALQAFGAQLYQLRLFQGRLAELTDALRANVEAFPHVPFWRLSLARAYVETDRLDEAREQMAVLGRDVLDPPLNWSWGSNMVVLSEVLWVLEDRPGAAILYDRLCPVAGQVGVAAGVLSATGSFALYCGRLAACLGRWAEAEQHFAEALTINQRIGARPYVVRTKCAWATMLLTRNAPGDRARAVELIAAGRAEAEQLGMARDVVLFGRLSARMAS